VTDEKAIAPIDMKHVTTTLAVLDPITTFCPTSISSKQSIDTKSRSKENKATTHSSPRPTPSTNPSFGRKQHKLPNTAGTESGLFSRTLCLEFTVARRKGEGVGRFGLVLAGWWEIEMWEG